MAPTKWALTKRTYFYIPLNCDASHEPRTCAEQLRIFQRSCALHLNGIRAWGWSSWSDLQRLKVCGTYPTSCCMLVQLGAHGENTMTKHVSLLATLLILAINVAGAAEPPSAGARLLHFDNPNRIRDSYFVAF